MSAPLDLSPLPILAGLAAGAAVGAVFFHALAAEVRLLLGGGALAGVALHLGRFALAAAVFVVAAFQGAPVLLAALAGFEGARRVMLRRGRGS